MSCQQARLRWLTLNTVRPVPKRAFAFGFIESLGQKIMVKLLKFSLAKGKNRLFWAVGMSNFRGLVMVCATLSVDGTYNRTLAAK